MLVTILATRRFEASFLIQSGEARNDTELLSHDEIITPLPEVASRCAVTPAVSTDTGDRQDSKLPGATL